MYKHFYGFQEKPFSIVPDPNFLYLSSKHRTALTYLEYGLMDRINFIVLTGGIGTGKTTLIKEFLTKMGANLETAVIFNTNVSSEDLLELILQEFELESPIRSKARHIDILNQFLINKYAQGKRVVLIVDEAQNLSQDALEEVRMLSNLQAGKDALLQIVLVGQPSLRAKLREPSLAQLCQRIAVSYHLGPLGSQETQDYIAYRLKKAGGEHGSLFSTEAIEQIFQASGGIPRTINVLCDAALVYGYADELSTIGKEVIEQVVSDKQELGLFVAARVGKDVQAQREDYQDDGNLLHRLESLEQRVDHLSSIVEKQVQQHAHSAETYKDTLVHKLERLLAEERRRTDKLLVQYSLLRNKLNLMKLDSEERKSEPVKKSAPGAARKAETASGQDILPHGFRNSLRKWFAW